MINKQRHILRILILALLVFALFSSSAFLVKNLVSANASQAGTNVVLSAGQKAAIEGAQQLLLFQPNNPSIFLPFIKR